MDSYLLRGAGYAVWDYKQKSIFITLHRVARTLDYAVIF